MEVKKVKVEIAADILNTKKSTIYSVVSVYTKEYGRLPEWYYKESYKDAYVDINYFNRLNSIVSEVKLYNTLKLYHILTDLGMTDTLIASYMAIKSSFTSPDSWRNFFTYRLWEIDERNLIYSLRKTQQIEFIRICTKLVYISNKRGRLIRKDGGIYFDDYSMNFFNNLKRK